MGSGSGYVGILSAELHFPENGSLKGKRKELLSVKAQLQYEGIYAKVASRVTASSSAQLSARRNEAMSRYLDKLRRETQVRYEPGYSPGP